MSIDMSVIIRAHDNIQCPPATVIKISLTSLYFIAHNIFSHEGIALRTNSLQFPGQFKMLLCMLIYVMCLYMLYVISCYYMLLRFYYTCYYAFGKSTAKCIWLFAVIYAFGKMLFASVKRYPIRLANTNNVPYNNLRMNFY